MERIQALTAKMPIVDRPARRAKQRSGLGTTRAPQCESLQLLAATCTFPRRINTARLDHVRTHFPEGCVQRGS